MLLITAHCSEYLPTVRELFLEYAQATGLNFCFQNFAAELAGLPGKYAPPAGSLFLADVDGQMAGCVAVRPLAGDVCEMKRLYVRPAFRGQGVGRGLAQATVAAARAAGYRRMRLDTLSTMSAAVALYESLGFVRIAAYYDNPIPDVVYLELALG